MSLRLFETVGADVERDAKSYVRIYDQAMEDMRRESVKIVHIYVGVYGKAVAHRAVRGDPKWDKLFAVLDLIPPTMDSAAYDQRQWIMTVDEFKELASGFVGQGESSWTKNNCKN